MKYLALLAIILGTSFTFSACSTAAVESRQQRITDAQSGIIERGEVRRGARDERFRASRARVMDLDE